MNAPYYEDDLVRLYHGDALDVLRTLPDASVDCCVTSPPYYKQRDYDTEGQYGLEASPAEYVETMRALFSEVRRVLADDGTLWLNIGDSYSGSWGNQGRKEGRGTQRPVNGPMLTPVHDGRYPTEGSRTGAIKPGAPPAKNLMGIPWRVAFALQDDGWILRNDIIFSKPNAMPESVTDRLSTKHEHVFMFAKAAWSGNSTLDLADVDAAWLAALIDGEGTITIGRNRRSERNPAHHDVFSASVSVANTSLPLLEKAGRLMGGANPARNNVGVNRPVYAVQVSGNKAAEVIAAVKPWLIDKAPQADIVLALQDTQRSAGVDKRAYQSSEGRAYKERLWEAVRAANRRETQDLSWVRPARRGRWSPRPYWFDLDPIREPHTSEPGREGANYMRGQKAMRPVGPNSGAYSEGGRNPGDVWTIATQPFTGAPRSVRPNPDPRGPDAPAYGKERIASADCSQHGSQGLPDSTPSHGGREVAYEIRTSGNSDHPGLVPAGGSESTETNRELSTQPSSSDSPHPPCGPSATPHSTESRRTDPAPSTSQPCTPSAQTTLHTERIEGLLDFDVPATSTHESSNGAPERRGAGARTRPRTPDMCTCSWVDNTPSTSHFAVMPIELARRAILAGCKPGGTVLDPFSGSGTTGLAAERTGRKYVGIDLNADYLDLSLRTRLNQGALDIEGLGA